MGHHPSWCYLYCKSKPYPKSCFCWGSLEAASICDKYMVKSVAEMAFLSERGSTPSMSSVSTRCCPVPRLTDPDRCAGCLGKPQGTVARVHSGQVILSICTKLQNKEHVIEALRRAKFKIPGRQKIHISKKWGFTKFNADELEDMVAEKRLIPDGWGVTYIPNCGPADQWRALHL
uniref:Ribosomal protein L10e/L16 domain-containing protein n=1 Tax=Spermophilus dauricus TaxID=99837 RepID=A0A8C9P2D2_SPEDA